MPYIVVTGSLSAPHLSKDEGAMIYGLNRDERAKFVQDLNRPTNAVAQVVEADKSIKINQKGLTLVVVNRLHTLFGYDVISHSMAMTNCNRELCSFTLYKKSSSSSHHGHSSLTHQGHSSSSHQSHSSSGHQIHSQSNHHQSHSPSSHENNSSSSHQSHSHKNNIVNV